ncbi:class A beta-lactamase-related serine hydrolase [Candidatus Parcubacteria bacterium]|nr:class A beta-lactamase-related serine hydrolase [Candidatus Parcubacteria bacterium]
MLSLYEKIKHNRHFPILISCLIIGNVLFLAVALYLKFFFLNSYPLIDISRNFIEQKNFIINVDPLRDYFENISKALGSNKMSLYLEYLNTGANISINRDLKIFPASLAKLPLAFVIMKKVEDKKLKLNDQIVIRNDDLDPLSGTLYASWPGTYFSVDKLLEALLVDSDNTAQRMLLRQVTVEDFQSLIDQTGLEELADPNGKISAKEYTRFFRALYTSSYLKREDSEKILELLSRSTFTEFLDRGLPKDVEFAHKYGEDVINKIYSDSGIVYLKGRPYMMTVMLQGLEQDKAREIMDAVSKQTYEYFSGKIDNR